jgi:hypothetical protein
MDSDDKARIRKLERMLKSLENEKDQSSKVVLMKNKAQFRLIPNFFFFRQQILHLQELNEMQTKNFQDAQMQRKLAVQEFTELNEKLNEFRTKNSKLQQDLMKYEDKIESLEKSLTKKDKTVDDIEKLNEKLQHEIKAIKKNYETNKLDDENLLRIENKSLEEEILKVRTKKTDKCEQTMGFWNFTVENYFQLAESNKQKECEMAKLNIEIDKLNDILLGIQNEKRELENEIVVFNEKKETMVKCEMQMNEILNMVNEERLVRDHLKMLAKKLIDEVDSLRSQCINNNNNNLNGNRHFMVKLYTHFVFISSSSCFHYDKNIGNRCLILPLLKKGLIKNARRVVLTSYRSYRG